MTLNFVGLFIQVIVSALVLAPVLWIAGRLMVGSSKARFIDSLWIVILGTLIGGIIGFFNVGILSPIIVLFLWLALIKKFFDCGWLRAFIISIVAVIVFVILIIVLGILGLAIFAIAF